MVDAVIVNSLHTPNHQLNYDEAVRRLNYWLNQPTSGQQQGAIRLLVGTLERDKNNLYFEETSDN